MDAKEQERKDQAARLRQAREAAGFETATDAAKAVKETVSTYTLHENGGRGYKAKADKYARAFKTTPEWLLWGKEPQLRGREARIMAALARFPETDREWAAEFVLTTLENLRKR